MSDGNGMIENPKFGSESTKNLAPRSLVSQSVETQLLPAEVFKGEQKGEVVGIEKIGETTAALKLKNDHYEACFYDSRGNLTTVTLDPSSIDVAKGTDRNDVATKRDNGSSFSEDLINIFERLGFSSSEQEHLREQWIRDCSKLGVYIDSYGDMSKASILQTKQIFLPVGDWIVEVIKNSDNNESFAFSVRDTHF